MQTTAPSLAASLAALTLFACSGATVPDGGSDDDAGFFDAATATCERDPDCDDGLFCNGSETCRPGNPEADPRGCVSTDPPCADGCDEAADRCGACSGESADADGDGDASLACGGTDCDDGDPSRYGDATEVCDAGDVDEDCDSSTLYSAGVAGAPGDRDGDGQVDVACANVIDGVEENRGTDCDDDDPAVFDGAPERCNGVDDDCDGAIDEDFDCVQSTEVVGTNGCGRDGRRRCSEACEWLDDGFVRDEDPSTCDYCDDTGEGIAAERGFATGRGLEHLDRTDTLHGDAASISFVDHVRVLDRAATGAGSVFTGPLEVGHGEIVFDADMDLSGLASAPPGNGWALSILTAAATTFVQSPTALGGTGVPTSEDGLAVTWEFHSGSGTNDRVRLLSTSAAALPDVVQTARPTFEFDDGSGTVRQRMRALITPDVLGTPSDETRVVVQVERFSGGFAVEFYDLLECGSAVGRPCGFTVTPGTSYYFGVTAASSGSRRATVETRSGTSVSVTTEELCR